MMPKTPFEIERDEYRRQKWLKNKKPPQKYRAKTKASVPGRGINKNTPNCKTCQHRIYQPDNVWNPDGCDIPECSYTKMEG